MPRRKPYNEQVNDGNGLDGVPGFEVRNPGFKHGTNFPDWKDGLDTIFRVVPEYRDGQFGPQRLGPDENNFGYWLQSAMMVRQFGIGAERFTFICEDLDGNEGPIVRLYAVIAAEVKNNPGTCPREWMIWIKSDDFKQKLSKPQRCGFVQGLLYQQGKYVYKNERTGKWKPHFPVLLVLPASARWGLSNLMNETVDGGGPPEKREDLVSRFKAGDLISPEGGHKVVFRPFQPPKGSNEKPGYRVSVEEQPEPIPAEICQSIWAPWEDLLNFDIDVEKQLNYATRATNPWTMDYVFGNSEFAHLLPDGVRGSWDRKCGRVSAVPDPAPSQPVQAPQQPPNPPKTPQSTAPPPQAQPTDTGTTDFSGTDFGGGGDGPPPDEQFDPGSGATEFGSAPADGSQSENPGPVQTEVPVPESEASQDSAMDELRRARGEKQQQ